MPLRLSGGGLGRDRIPGLGAAKRPRAVAAELLRREMNQSLLPEICPATPQPLASHRQGRNRDEGEQGAQPKTKPDASREGLPLSSPV